MYIKNDLFRYVASIMGELPPLETLYHTTDVDSKNLDISSKYYYNILLKMGNHK